MAEQAARQGQPADAVTLIEIALAGIRHQQIPSLLTDSTVARARPGKQCDLDAAELGMEAIQLTEDVDSGRCVGLIRNLYHQLTPHATAPAGGDFLDRARDLITV